MKFRSRVEPNSREGLEIPPQAVEALGAGKRPRVIVTINGHYWRSRVAIMRGRYLLGLSNANRQAARVATGEEVKIELALDTAPIVVNLPDEFARALDADPRAYAAYDRLTQSQKTTACTRHRKFEEAGDAHTTDRKERWRPYSR